MFIRKFCSPSALKAELEVVRLKVSLQETRSSWDVIEQGILQLTECCNNGGCSFPTEMIAGIRSLSTFLTNAMNSERTRLSGSAIELVSALSMRLGPSFQPLVSVFLPTLLCLCARTNKVYTSYAKACIFAVITHSQSTSILLYLVESVHHKSASLRLVAAQGVLACLKCFNRPEDTYARFIEDVIKSTSRDATSDVRAAGKMILDAYKTLYPDRMSCIASLTSIIKKHSEYQGSTSKVPSRRHPATHPLSVKLISTGSLPKSVASRHDPKPVTRKIHLSSAAIVRPSSRMGPQPYSKAEHPTMGGTSSQIGQPRATEIAPQTSSQTSRKKVVASTSKQQAVCQSKPVWGGRTVTKGPKPDIKALPIRSTPIGTKDPAARKPAVPLPPSHAVCSNAVPSPSSPVSYQREPGTAGEPLVQVTMPPLCNAQDILFEPKTLTKPLLSSTPSLPPYMLVRFQRALKRPRYIAKHPTCKRRTDTREDSICIDSTASACDVNTHSRSENPFITPSASCVPHESLFTPPSHDIHGVGRPSDMAYRIQRIPKRTHRVPKHSRRTDVDVTASPIEVNVQEVIALAQTTDSPKNVVNLFQGCELRQVVGGLDDVRLDHATMLFYGM